MVLGCVATKCLLIDGGGGGDSDSGAQLTPPTPIFPFSSNFDVHFENVKMYKFELMEIRLG